VISDAQRVGNGGRGGIYGPDRSKKMAASQLGSNRTAMNRGAKRIVPA
jgi:hypothetical protein